MQQLELDHLLYKTKGRRVIDNEAEVSQEGAYSFYILWICSHAYAMHKRNILDDNE